MRDRTHPAHCDYGVTYGGGRRGRCTCGLIAEELTADQVIRVIALRAALESSQMSADARYLVARAQTFETYLRGESA
ncbi:hypothetical protein DEJ49_33325 [Streptomyces venezuelae]|uniref:Uncharacterized protein n=1 Tax=Streptomyces venezuelae TaxID=54571 RepID=A0A5P2CS38_STRVZ|nr:hypothetical protein [Streptomyces venezuelae]QES45223.1 hypothetical protein DEJ49_33325 [Streptomyces venezuelae]